MNTQQFGSDPADVRIRIRINLDSDACHTVGRDVGLGEGLRVALRTQPRQFGYSYWLSSPHVRK